MRALQFTEFGPVSNLRLLELPDPKADAATAIVKVAAGAISPSDVKNVEGTMEHTTLPRVPGRDYAGTVIHGPGEWISAEVGGTGGEIGDSVDGSHAELMAVPVASLRRKPKTLSFEQAAAIGATYLAAWLGVVEYAQLAPGETLLVIGAGGGAGGVAAQIGKWRGARVIGVDQRQLRSDSPAARAVDDFCVLHHERRLFWVDTRQRDATAWAALLEALTSFFDDGAFQPPMIDLVIPLSEGRAAYEEVARGEARGRLVLVP
jgi:NADPH:quinone reductase-like Zn-dependent oxidoreductase